MLYTTRKPGIADCVTLFRIPCAAAMLLFSPNTAAFQALYLIAGLSDMIDGHIARKTSTASDRGAKLDTLADCVFALCAVYSLILWLKIPAALLCWAAGIACLKLLSGIIGWRLHHRLLSVHSPWNKAAGLVCYLMPGSLPWISISTSGTIACVLATAAAIHELFCALQGREIH